MARARTSQLLLPVLVLAAISLSACSTDTPVAVDEGPALYAPLFDAASCPTEDAMCDLIASELNAQCPLDRDYRNRGQLTSCEQSLTNDMLNQLDGCFDGHQLKAIKSCVYQKRLSQLTNHDRRRFMD